MLEHIKQDQIPSVRNSTMTYLDDDLRDFMNCPSVTAARVILRKGDSTKSAYSRLRRTAVREGCPVRVFMRDGTVYLVKTDSGKEARGHG